MDNFERIEEYQAEIKEIFKDLADEELYLNWADTFDIECYDNSVVITYYGTESFKKFKKECKNSLIPCIYTVVGRSRKIVFTNKRITPSDNTVKISPKVKKNIKAVKFFVIGMIFVCFAASVILVLANYISNRNFRETFYSASSIKIDSRIRVIQLSDMHKASYGKDNQKLLERIEALEPDIIICTGDIVNSATDNIDYAVSLGTKLAKIAPSYYVYGNNEIESIYNFSFNEKDLDEKFGFNQNNRDETAMLKIKDSFEEQLEKTGMKVLKNEKDTIQIKTMTVDVYGVLNSNPSSFWSYSEKAFNQYLNENPDNIKITAVHEPFIFEQFETDYWGDLMLCGHTHGGLMRIPMLGPLYTPEAGLFPERSGNLVYGRYDVSGSPLIVSGGLENSNPLRINNQPELVIIDINKF